jgi:hypothetical protein
MIRKFFHLGWAVLILAAVISAQGGDVIDRIVASVNGHIILQSDWDEALCYETLADGRPLVQSTLEQRKAALDRLIDQELIRQQLHASDFLAATPAEIDRRIAEIRKLHPEAVDDVSWKNVLQHYQLTETELRKKAAAELDELRAVDARLRPGVQIDSASVESYYRDKLLPELRQAGAPEVPLDEVAPKIKELLTQQKVNDLLVTWLRTLRSESKIHTPFDSTAASGGGSR